MSAEQSVCHDNPFPFGTLSGASSKIALTSVAVAGTVDGLLFTATIRQEYKNDTDTNLEVIYTFPMGWDTALLGMSAEIGEKRLTAKVIEKNEAEETYEDAVAKGDSAIMVQKSAKGLYTANLGNILPHERVVVELTCARLLRFEQGRVRLVIPTVIGERYGDPFSELAPHETARVDPNVHYDFTLSMTLHGELSRATITCPSHKISMLPAEDGKCFTLNGALDRDFVLLIEGLSAASFAQYVKRNSEVLVAASFAPSFAAAENSPLGFKILVDCSGSMDGESIHQAKQGLAAVARALEAQDYVSYSCFGSRVQRLIPRLSPCTKEEINYLRAAVAATNADLGGTEMEAALADTFSIPCPEGIPPMVLCITDGDVWDAINIVKTAKDSGHRVFAIGVGSAPAESLLREIAEQTGGACEFVTENENMADAVVRMMQRMRGSIVRDITVDWHSTPLWQSKTPKFLYNGETVHCFALTQEIPSEVPALHYRATDGVHTITPSNLERTASEELFRLAMARRLEETEDPQTKQQLALTYQLVSDQTSLILVCPRDETHKSHTLPTVQQVPQMPAAGHGCYARPFAKILNAGICCFSAMEDSPRDSSLDFGLADDSLCLENSLDDDPLLDDGEQEQQDLNSTLADLVEHFVERSLSCTTIEACMATARKDEDLTFLTHLASELGIDINAVWAIFLEWASEHCPSCHVSRHAKRLLRAALQQVPEDIRKTVRERCETWAAQY